MTCLREWCWIFGIKGYVQKSHGRDQESDMNHKEGWRSMGISRRRAYDGMVFEGGKDIVDVDLEGLRALEPGGRKKDVFYPSSIFPILSPLPHSQPTYNTNPPLWRSIAALRGRRTGKGPNPLEG